ncbi:MAG: FimD/PapC N-terminal domain-containing protein, partial [Paraburkholderia hospita]
MKPSLQRKSQRPASATAGSFMLNPVTAVVLSVFTMAGFMSAGAACAAEAVEFDTTFLQIDSQRVDVARLGRGNIVSPGAYTVDISINDNHVARESVRFTAVHEGENARACLTRKMLEAYGVDFTKLTNAADQGADACVDVSASVPDATVEFDFNEQKLNITIPQKYMRNLARGYVAPELWDNGVNAGFLSYNANAYRTASGGTQASQEYLGLNAGVNIGAWHFRHQSSVTAGTGQSIQLDNIATYVQHDV